MKISLRRKLASAEITILSLAKKYGTLHITDRLRNDIYIIRTRIMSVKYHDKLRVKNEII